MYHLILGYVPFDAWICTVWCLDMYHLMLGYVPYDPWICTIVVWSVPSLLGVYHFCLECTIIAWSVPCMLGVYHNCLECTIIAWSGPLMLGVYHICLECTILCLDMYLLRMCDLHKLLHVVDKHFDLVLEYLDKACE